MIFQTAAAAAALGVASVVWGVIEARLHHVRSYEIPVLPAGSQPIEILQVSDLHLRRSTKRLMGFLESLSTGTYDIVLATGDLLSEVPAVERCADLLNALNGRSARAFVLGSSDYFQPMLKGYLDYFLKRKRFSGKTMPTGHFKDLLTSEGWLDLTNSDRIVDTGGMVIQLTGMDDPHLGWEDRSVLKRNEKAGVSVCVVHDPGVYKDVAATGYDLQVSGHTHGGQVRMPIVGALVTNSSLPRSLARGLHRVSDMYLFVSPGLGTGKLAPFRFLCRPEASVLRLVPRLSQS